MFVAVTTGASVCLGSRLSSSFFRRPQDATTEATASEVKTGKIPISFSYNLENGYDSLPARDYDPSFAGLVPLRATAAS